MPISFNTVPSNLRTPLVSVEFDNTRASKGPALLAYRVLMIGQMLTGTATANVPVRCTSAKQAQTLCGRGSQLALMAAAWFLVNKATELWLLPLADNGAGVAATKTLTVTGTATAAGTISIYIGGVLVQVAVASGDVQNTIATAIAAAITANGDLPVTAAAATNVATTTARNKGVAGQDLNIRLNYQDGDALPAGVTVAIANAVSGITNPVLTTAIANLGDVWYHLMIHPYYDATSFTAIETELARRNGPSVMVDGYAITSAPGTQGTLATLGLTRNSQFTVIMSQPGEVIVTSPQEFAAAAGAAVAAAGSDDPGRPFQTLALPGVKKPADLDLFMNSERNLLLFDGVSTSVAAAGGVVQLERVITAYQTNAAGAPDTSYLDMTTLLTLMYLRYTFRVRIAQRYPRHKLTNDGVRPDSGQAVITPSIGKAEAIAWFKEMQGKLLVENLDQFKQDLIVERNATDPNRLDFLLPPDLINQLIVAAAKVQFGL